MANKILVARGTKARIEEIKSTLATNELVYSTDTGELGVKKADGNIEYFMNATDINARVDTLETANAYFIYAASVYGDKYSLFANAWEHSLTVDPSEISADGEYSNNRGKAQYPNGETDGVIIPQGVTTIGDYAFGGWSANNQPLVIPNSVTSIGNSAFSFWTSNTHPLVIPNSVTSIGNSAFYYWQSNTHPLVIPENVTSIGNNAFSNWTSNNQPLTIPNSVTTIGNLAFDNWQSNNHPLIIPNSVTSIGEYAFQNWEANNKPLVIPNSVTSIGDYAFLYWSLVPYVEIQSLTPPTLGGAAAFYGQNDAPIYVPDESVDDYKTATNWSVWADRIFPISDKPDDIDDIEEVISLLDEKQDKLVAGDNITIDPTTNVISASGGGIDLNMLGYMNYAADIFYKERKQNLFANAWEHSLTVDPTNVSSTQYPNGETEPVIIPHGATKIGGFAFLGWLNNQPLVIPNSVTSIDGGAFASWSANTHPLIIPNSVTSIGNNAFYNWSSNTHPLVIPDSVTSIINGAFANWTLVPYVEIQATTPPSLGSSSAFDGQNNAPIYVPDESVEAYKAATNWVELADRIFPIGDKTGVIGDIESALDAILGV